MLAALLPLCFPRNALCTTAPPVPALFAGNKHSRNANAPVPYSWGRATAATLCVCLTVATLPESRWIHHHAPQLSWGFTCAAAILLLTPPLALVACWMWGSVACLLSLLLGTLLARLLFSVGKAVVVTATTPWSVPRLFTLLGGYTDAESHAHVDVDPDADPDADPDNNR